MTDLKTQSKYPTLTYLLLTALFAALTAISSWMSVPLPFTPVPINLATLAVFLAGGLLGRKYGTLSIIVFTLLGAVGLPVFHGFTGGIGILAGPTGGYIIGYIVAAFVIGLLTDLCNNSNSFWKYICITIAGLLCCYLLGTVWFMFSANTGFIPSLALCVVPFLPGDAFKILAASILLKKLKPLLF